MHIFSSITTQSARSCAAAALLRLQLAAAAAAAHVIASPSMDWTAAVTLWWLMREAERERGRLWHVDGLDVWRRGLELICGWKLEGVSGGGGCGHAYQSFCVMSTKEGSWRIKMILKNTNIGFYSGTDTMCWWPMAAMGRFSNNFFGLPRGLPDSPYIQRRRVCGSGCLAQGPYL
jgi:hypothetical protein